MLNVITAQSFINSRPVMCTKALLTFPRVLRNTDSAMVLFTCMNSLIKTLIEVLLKRGRISPRIAWSHLQVITLASSLL